MEERKTFGISNKEKIAYAFGDFGGVLTFSLISSFLLKFYTDCLTITNAQIVVLMLVARLWDAINDPLWGGYIDSRKPTKYGRFRPYVMRAAIPLAIGAVLMFIKIPGLSQTGYLVFAYVTYIFYGMMYTGANIPYGSLASVITTDQHERSSLSVWRSIGSGFGNIPSMIILPLFVYSVVLDAQGNPVLNESGKVVKALDPQKLLFGVIGIAIISVFVFYFHFKNVTERVEALPSTAEKKSKAQIFKTVADLAKNPPFVILCVASMLFIAFQMYTQTSYNYLFSSYYGNGSLYIYVTLCTYLPMAALLPVVGKLVKKYGKKEVSAVGLAFAAVINFVMYIVGFTGLGKNPMVFLALLLLSGVGQTFLTFEVWALVTDTINYHELNTGRREEGIAYSVYTFTRKLGQALAGVGVPALFIVIGYDGKKLTQSAETLKGLYTMSTLIPAIALTIMFVLLGFGYKLTKKRTDDIYEQMAERQ